MISPKLSTGNPRLLLVPPVVARDAPCGVAWLTGPEGRQTLALMGVPEKDNHVSTLEAEQRRIGDFLTDPKHLAWMMRLDNGIIGVVEVSFKATPEIPLPAVSIMIGDPAARGQGLGYAALEAAVRYLVTERKFRRLYARHLVDNRAAQALFEKLGFEAYGEPYTDADGLQWQNRQREE